jgi:hypothetical protein
VRSGCSPFFNLVVSYVDGSPVPYRHWICWELIYKFVGAVLESYAASWCSSFAANLLPLLLLGCEKELCVICAFGGAITRGAICLTPLWVSGNVRWVYITYGFFGYYTRSTFVFITVISFVDPCLILCMPLIWGEVLVVCGTCTIIWNIGIVCCNGVGIVRYGEV